MKTYTYAPLPRKSSEPSTIPEWRAINGWLSDIEADTLYHIALKQPHSARVAELGTWAGKSTVAIGLGLVGKDAKMWTIDHFKHGSGPTYGQVNENLRKFNLDFINVIIADHRTCRLQCNISMLFCDGSDNLETGQGHEYKTFKQTILEWSRIIIHKGIIICHDYNQHNWPGVKKAVDETLGQWHDKTVIGSLFIANKP